MESWNNVHNFFEYFFHRYINGLDPNKTVLVPIACTCQVRRRTQGFVNKPRAEKPLIKRLHVNKPSGTQVIRKKYVKKQRPWTRCKLLFLFFQNYCFFSKLLFLLLLFDQRPDAVLNLCFINKLFLLYFF